MLTIDFFHLRFMGEVNLPMLSVDAEYQDNISVAQPLNFEVTDSYYCINMCAIHPIMRSKTRHDLVLMESGTKSHEICWECRNMWVKGIHIFPMIIHIISLRESTEGISFPWLTQSLFHLLWSAFFFFLNKLYSVILTILTFCTAVSKVYF